MKYSRLGDDNDHKRDSYLVESVLRACDLLKALDRGEAVLRLRDLVSRTGLNPATALRLLRTLERGELIQRVRKNEYRSNIEVLRRSTYKFGYASQGEDSTFAQEWSDSITRVAAERGLNLLVLDNGFDPATTLKNVDLLIREKVDLAIEHQFDEQIAPVITSKLLEAKIPLIAMGTAHPGAIYFGGNNYKAGLIGGRCLGHWANQHWHGKADELLLLVLSKGGPLLNSRLKGIEAGVKQLLHTHASLRITHLEGNGQFGPTLDLVGKYLRHTCARRILVGAFNDPCACGALRAFEESCWEAEDYAVVGHGGSLEGRAELLRPGSRFAGTVAFFPEKYGDAIFDLALDILNKKPVPPALFTKHMLLTAENVGCCYPNDRLINRETVNNPLLQCQRTVR